MNITSTAKNEVQMQVVRYLKDKCPVGYEPTSQDWDIATKIIRIRNYIETIDFKLKWGLR